MPEYSSGICWIGRILKKGALFLALKGRYITAQGNALGKYQRES